jgi:primary-amine oxidase
LTDSKVLQNKRLEPEFHGATDFEEMDDIAKLVDEDEQVKAVIAKLQLPEGAVVVAEPWMFGKTCPY